MSLLATDFSRRYSAPRHLHTCSCGRMFACVDKECPRTNPRTCAVCEFERRQEESEIVALHVEQGT